MRLDSSDVAAILGVLAAVSVLMFVIQPVVITPATTRHEVNFTRGEWMTHYHDELARGLVDGSGLEDAWHWVNESCVRHGDYCQLGDNNSVEIFRAYRMRPVVHVERTIDDALRALLHVSVVFAHNDSAVPDHLWTVQLLQGNAAFWLRKVEETMTWQLGRNDNKRWVIWRKGDSISGIEDSWIAQRLHREIWSIEQRTVGFIVDWVDAPSDMGACNLYKRTHTLGHWMRTYCPLYEAWDIGVVVVP